MKDDLLAMETRKITTNKFTICISIIRLENGKENFKLLSMGSGQAYF